MNSGAVKSPYSLIEKSNLLHEYIHKYYNPARTHQGINCETPFPSEKYGETTIAETVLKSTPVLGGLYHSYQKVA